MTGTISLQIGFLEPKNAASSSEALDKVKKVFESLRGQSSGAMAGVLGVPAVCPSTQDQEYSTHSQHQGIGTIKMRRGSRRTSSTPGDGSKRNSAMSFLHSALSRKQTDDTPEVEDDDASDSESLNDDGLTSSSGTDDDSAVEDDDDGLETLHESPSMLDETVQAAYNASTGMPVKSGTGKKQLDQVIREQSGPPKTPSRQSSQPGYFDHSSRSDSDAPGLSTPGAATPGGTKIRKPMFKRNKTRAVSNKSSRRDFNFDASGGDVQGIVVMEINSASDLPKLKNGEYGIESSIDGSTPTHL